MTTTSRTRWLLALVALIFLVILIAGGWFYREQERYVRRNVEEEIEAIAELKVGDIVRWRRERLADAHLLLHSRDLVVRAMRYLHEPNAEDEEAVVSRFNALCEYYGYSDVLLVDTDGAIHIKRSGVGGRINGDARPALEEALRTSEPVLADLQAEGVVPAPHLSVIAPLMSGWGSTRRAAGAIILVSDARQYLYPLIQLWPKPSVTAETLLVRRDGDDVLFLNELRHRTNAALRLRIPANEVDLPAAAALRGAEGAFYGRDYRGVEVVSVLLPVPGTPWFMISKMDQAEAFAAWRYRAVLILGLIVAGLLLAAAAAGVVWHRNEAAQYAALFREEKARHETEERYRVTLMSVGDGVIVTDTDGRARMLNPVAEQLTGWKEAEARGRPLKEVFRIVNEETRVSVESPVQRVLSEGRVVGLANHTILVARDGTERAIADSGAPIRDSAGGIVGVVLVFRDQSAERVVERAVETERNNIKAIMAASPVGLLVLDDQETVTDVNPAAERVLGRKLSDLKNRRCGDFIACPHRGEDPHGCGNSPSCATCPLLSAVRAVLKTGVGILDREAEIQTESPVPSARWLRFSVEAVTLSGRRHVVMALDDITERKRAAEEVRKLLGQGERDRMALLGILEDQQQARKALQESAQQLKRAQQIARMGNWVWDIAGRKLAWSDELRRIWGVADDVALTEESINAMIHPDDRERNAREVWTLLQSGTSVDFEFRIVRPDREVRHVHQVAEIVRGEDGRPARAFGIMQDITAQKKAEAAIREQLDELRRWHKAMQGREARVIELKREVNGLLAKLGKPVKYASAEEEEEGAS